MASKSSVLKVDVVTDAKGVHAGLAESESRFSKWGNRLKAVGKMAAVGLAAGAAAAGVGLFKLAQGAADDEAAASKLAATLQGKTIGATKAQVAATEDWISKQGVLYGVTDDELRPALGRLAVATGDVGKAHKLTSLAMNVATGTGKSLEAVSTALAKAQTGNVGALGRLGIATKDAAGHTLSLDQVTANLARTYKGQAATAANTTAGRFQRLKVMLSEAGESIGYKLLPLGTKLAGWLLKTAPKVQHFAEQLGHKLAPAFTAVGHFISNVVVPAAQSFTHWYIEKIVPGIKRFLIPIIDAARDAFDKIGKKVHENGPQLRDLGNIIKNVAEFIGNKFMPVAGKLIGWAIRLQTGIIGGVIDVIGGLVRGFHNAADAVERLVGWIGRIHFPSVPGWVKSAGGFLGFGANVQQLRIGGMAGGSPSYGAGAGLATASSSSTSWWSSARAGMTSTRPAGGTYVDARTFVQVDGALDADAVARQLERIMAARDRRLGRRTAPAWA